jgi:hypothetical protein
VYPSIRIAVIAPFGRRREPVPNTCSDKRHRLR